MVRSVLFLDCRTGKKDRSAIENIHQCLYSGDCYCGSTLAEISTENQITNSSACSLECSFFYPYPSSEKCGSVDQITVYKYGVNADRNSSLLTVDPTNVPPTRPINIIPVCVIFSSLRIPHYILYAD